MGRWFFSEMVWRECVCTLYRQTAGMGTVKDVGGRGEMRIGRVE